MLDKSGKEYTDLLKKHYGSAKVNGFPLIMENMHKRNIFVEATGHTFTKEEVLAIALNWGNETNRQRLMDGRDFLSSPAQVEAVLDTLTENDWQFVQGVWNMINQHWDAIVEREKRRTGIIPKKVEPSPFSTKYGEMAGGYYPIKFDRALDKKAIMDELDVTFEDMTRGTLTRAATKKGHLKERVQNVQRPVRISLSVINQHLTEVLTDLALGEAVEGSYKVLHHPKVKAAIYEHQGIEAFKQLDSWLKDTAVGSIVTGDAFSGMLKGLRAGVSIGAMGLKVSTTLVQVSGLAQSVVEIRPKYMAIGLTKFIRNPVKA
jgi:hypothetical protein